MKHYKLQAWPDLGAPFQRTAHRRVLHHMSQRYVSVPQLMHESGLARAAVVQLLDKLREKGLLVERELSDGPSSSRFGSLRPIAWLRRTFAVQNPL